MYAMTNNDILRRIRYIFDLDDSKVIAIFAHADLEVSRAQISDWLKKDEDPEFKDCSDLILAIFLNGFITEKRGAKEGDKPKPEKFLTNNLILMKLKIALNLKAEDILELLESVDQRLSKHELSAFFRKPNNRQYRECQNQVLRKLLEGLRKKHRVNE